MFKVKNKKLFVAFIAWFVLVLFSILQYPQILNGSCFFQNSWLFCVANLNIFQKISLSFLFFLIIFGFFIYGFHLWQCFKQNKLNLSRKKIVFLIIIFISLAFLVVPFGSADMTYYYSSGKAIDSGINPFTEDWTRSNHFILPKVDENVSIGFSYGPVVASIFHFFYKLSGDSIFVFILMWKLFVIAISFLCWFLVYKLIRLHNTDFKLDRFLFIFLLQPLFLFEWVVSGHFDALWLVFVLLAFLLARHGKWWLVFLSLAVGIWMKFIPLLLTPWFLLWWYQELNVRNWLKHTANFVIGILLGLLFTFIVWKPFWVNFDVFDAIVLQSKWVVNSFFSVLYYTLEPVAQYFFIGQSHWYLTRFVHGLLLVFVLYMLWPYIKSVSSILLRKIKWTYINYIEAIFFTMLVYLLLWQKSFWPWYLLWLIPLGIIVYTKTKNIYLEKILIWGSLSPFIFYIMWILNKIIIGTDAYAELWFHYVVVIFVMSYLFINIFKYRKQMYRINSIHKKL